MATSTKTLQIILTAKDEASQVIRNVSNNISNSLGKAKLASAGLAVALGVGLKSVVDSASEYERSILGLQTVAKAFKVDQEEATKAARELASDGLMSVRDAAESLKNLLATGFSLPQAINLMKGFKDSAAFNRQGTLDFGEAIVGATQGLKNQNSIMVDNAGVTKNLSVILKEAGYSQADLGLITSDASVRMALYNGILKETAIFSGDASKASESYQGKVAELNTAIFNLKVKIGNELLPIITKFIETGLLPAIDKISELTDWFIQHKEATTILAGAIIGALVPAVYAAVTAFAALAVTLAPFIIAGGIIAAVVTFLNYLMVETTGYTLLEQLTAAFEIVRDSAQSMITSLKEAINWITKFMDKYSLAIHKTDFSPGGKFHFQHGGFIDAPSYQAVPAVLHGNERVVPRVGVEGSSMGGSNISINFSGPISMDSPSRVKELANQIITLLGRQNELALKGASI